MLLTAGRLALLEWEAGRGGREDDMYCPWFWASSADPLLYLHLITWSKSLLGKNVWGSCAQMCRAHN